MLAFALRAPYLDSSSSHRNERQETIVDVILVNLGTPREPTPEAVRDFLEEFLSDPRVVDFPRWLWQPILRGIVLKKRPSRVAGLYESIWTPEGSPLEVGTRKMATALAHELGEGTRVRHAYRYGEPSLPRLVEESMRDGRRPVVIHVFPQRTGATSGTIEVLAYETAARMAGRGRREKARLRVGAPPPDCPDYVEALADRCQETFERMGGSPDHLLLSFHGIPVRFDRDENGAYSRACRATAEALLDRLSWQPERATLAYQSRFGPERWLGPATDRVLEELPGRGVRSVAVSCPGFLTDGLETLEEIGVQGRETFLGAGGEGYALVPAVEDHPAMIRSLARQAHH
jgi:ferrochelatase